MRVFVTGATGFIGLAVAQELIGAGHQVLGLVRSEAGANPLRALGAQIHRGDLEDPESLRTGAAMADGVIHCAFNHDFSRYAANCELDQQAIEVLGSALSGSGRPFVVTAGIGMLAPGRAATEEDLPPAVPQFPRVSEQTAVLMAGGGVPMAVIRLPQVHDPVKQGFVSFLIAVAREKSVSAYVGDGRNRWAAVHRHDAARLYRLALEKAASHRNSEPARYHAVGEEGVPMKEIAEAIGRGLRVPVVAKSPDEAAQHFGFLGAFAGMDMPASSVLTQERLGWRPAGPGLISDLEAMRWRV
jgi:nucleoside-diphosphate-sugar epimerase